jgi:hypothetical protein
MHSRAAVFPDSHSSPVSRSYSPITLAGANFSVQGAGGFRTTIMKCPFTYNASTWRGITNGSLFEVSGERVGWVCVDCA